MKDIILMTFGAVFTIGVIVHLIIDSARRHKWENTAGYRLDDPDPLIREEAQAILANQVRMAEGEARGNALRQARRDYRKTHR